jgi:choline kinase
MATKTGVVLAAGFGSRLAGISAETDLKPLTPVAGRPLMLRTLDSLAAAGCDRAVVVVGYSGVEVQSAIEEAYTGPLEIIFAHNEQYKLSNGLSVLAAAPHLSGTFLLTMADHVFGADVMAVAGAHIPPDGGATLLVDHKLDDVFDMDDATKVLEENGVILAIGKEIESFNSVDTGLFVCTSGLIDAIRAVYERSGDSSLSDGVHALSESGKMTVLDIGNGFWQDVDTPEMLREAESRLLGTR